VLRCAEAIDRPLGAPIHRRDRPSARPRNCAAQAQTKSGTRKREVKGGLGKDAPVTVIPAPITHRLLSESDGAAVISECGPLRQNTAEFTHHVLGFRRCWRFNSDLPHPLFCQRGGITAALYLHLFNPPLPRAHGRRRSRTTAPPPPRAAIAVLAVRSRRMRSIRPCDPLSRP
jgi:hypothetical protein